ncbi:MAG: hypothetical protein K2W85_08365 [Phycisphaerales bacterium]|nr:hypothetical protein [Phycisphaerales bacterium]
MDNLRDQPFARTIVAVLGVLGSASVQAVASGPTVVNWETPHVAPLALSADGNTLLAVNTAGASLEIFQLSSGVPVRAGRVPVGLDPVTVRMRSNTEAWVVNHISDTVSIVDLSLRAVVATIKTPDEPWDVVFAGSGAAQRAFISCGTDRVVLEYDPSNLTAPTRTIQILGEQPRALGVSADGSKVYVAVFESGNASTVLGGNPTGGNFSFPPAVVGLAGTPYGGVNPPPNFGASFNPPIAQANQTFVPPRVSLIVKRDSGGLWKDDNNRDWTNWVSGASAASSGRRVGWTIPDNDLGIIDTATGNVTYANRLMNICMALAVNPATGHVAVIGTDATNEVRFEPVLNGKFLRVRFSRVDPATPSATILQDLNPHLNYSTGSVQQSLRDLSVGDPRGIAYESNGERAWITGMGSNNVVVVDDSGNRAGSPQAIELGVPNGGPTGVIVDDARGQVYVLNKFAGVVSTLSTATRTLVRNTPFFDPTPQAIKVGRKHLYDTRRNSGLGIIACASCHIDGKMDRLAWDLGDPTGDIIGVNLSDRNLGQGLIGLSPGTTNPAFQNYHPMKGPMTTQTFQDIIGKEPHHWRGDRLGLEEFNGAFVGLQSKPAMLSNTEMQEFEDFLATITYPPNPFRNFDNTLPTNLPLPGHFTTGRFGAAGLPLPNGNAVNGLNAYRSQTTRLDMNAFACVTCHTLPTGAGTDFRMTGPTTPPYVPIAAGPLGNRHLQLVSTDGVSNITMKTPQLRNLYKKRGFNVTQLVNTSGFGMLHDGSVDSIERFISEPVFTVTGNQMVADLTAFMLSFSGSELPLGSVNSPLEPPGPPSNDSHAAIGAQSTASATVDTTRINAMIALADAGKVGIIARGRLNAAISQRGWKYNGSGQWRSDRTTEPLISTAALLAQATASTPITVMVVPLGTQDRLGVDADCDTFFDADELSVCSDPANPFLRPGTPLCLDADGNLAINTLDLFTFLNFWFTGPADFDQSGATDTLDVFAYLNAWFAGCS